MSLTFLALSLTVLLGFAGLATDSGMVWVTRARLQHSVDAAALAAAQELPATTTATTNAARAVACDYATARNAVPGMAGKTGSCGGQTDVEFPAGDGTAVRVTAYRTVQPVFGQLLGFAPVEVEAHATARIGSVASRCMFPFFLTPDRLANSADFFFPINFLEKNRYINVGNWKDAADAMIDCTSDNPASEPGEVGDTGIAIHPGTVNSIDKAWQSWVDWSEEKVAGIGGSSCPSQDVSTVLNQVAPGKYELKPGITAVNCPRLIVVPVLSVSSDGKRGDVEGFIAVYFSDIVSKREITGYAVRLDIGSVDYTDYSPGYGSKIVTLVD